MIKLYDANGKTRTNRENNEATGGEKRLLNGTLVLDESEYAFLGEAMPATNLY